VEGRTGHTESRFRTSDSRSTVAAVSSTWGLLLHQAVQFEPIGSSAVAASAFGHSDQQTLAQAAGLARRPVLLVDDALAAILALADHRQVVVRTTEERLASFTCESAEMEPSSWLAAHFAQLVHLESIARHGLVLGGEDGHGGIGNQLLRSVGLELVTWVSGLCAAFESPTGALFWSRFH